jgi:hypothetical protein
MSVKTGIAAISNEVVGDIGKDCQRTLKGGKGTGRPNLRHFN